MKFFTTILILLALVSCSKEGKVEEVADTKESIKRFPVDIEVAKVRDLNSYISFTAKLEGISEVVMSSETNGKIVKVNKGLGDFVTKGETIGMVDNISYRIRVDQAKANLKSAEANLEIAKSSMEASKELLESGSISESEYNQAVANLKSMDAVVDGAKAGLEDSEKELNNSYLNAPISGYITSIPIKKGEYLSRGAIVCEIVDSRKLIAKTGVGEMEILSLSKGKEVSISSPHLSGSISGKISGVSIKPAPNSSAYPVEIEIDNVENSLYPGMVVSGKILNKVYKDIFYLYRGVIQEEYDKRFIYVEDGNKAVKRYVKLGKEIDEVVIIDEGISADDKIITSGISNLEDGVGVVVISG